MAKKNKTKSDGSVLVYIGTPGKKKAKKNNSVLLPVSPEKINYKYKNQNKTFKLINGEEVNLVLPPGLTEITMEKILLPNKAYSFCHKNSNKEVWSAGYLLKLFSELKANRSVFPLAINASSDGLCNDGYSESRLCTLEDYNVNRSVDLNNDLEATVTFKEYAEYGVQTVTLKKEKNKKDTKKKKKRAETKEQTEEQTYTVKSGDTLWAISKKFYGDGSLYPYLASLNGLKNPNVLQVGQVLKIGPKEEAEKYKGTSGSYSTGSKNKTTGNNVSRVEISNATGKVIGSGPTGGYNKFEKAIVEGMKSKATEKLIQNLSNDASTNDYGGHQFGPNYEQGKDKNDEATQKLIDNLSSDVSTSEYGESPFGPNYKQSAQEKLVEYTDKDKK